MAEQGLGRFSSGAVPPAPSFADFRFSTIGQDPLLLKRMQSPDLHYNGSLRPSSPAPGELEYPSSLELQPKPLLRPTLLQSLTPSGADAGQNSCSAFQSADVSNTPSAELPLLPQPKSSVSSQHTSFETSAVSAPLNAVARATAISSSPVPSHSQKEQTSVSVSSSEVSRTIVPAKKQMPLPAPSLHHNHSSYAALRALHARLVTSLSKLQPPDMTEVLLRVQSANSHSVKASATARRSHILAEQSLAVAQEAIAAARESLSDAETARTHASDALTAARQLHSGKAGLDAEGSADWQVNYSQIEDDLRMLEEWLAGKEKEDIKSRDVDRQGVCTENEKAVEAVKCARVVSGFGSRVVQDRSSEMSPQVRTIQNRRSGEASHVTSHPGLPSNRDLGLKKLSQLEAGTVTKVWNSEQSFTSTSLSPITSGPIPMEAQIPLGDHLPPKADGQMLLQEKRQPSQSNEAPPLSSIQHRTEEFTHLSEDETRLQHEEQPTLMQQKRVTPEELPESVVNAPGLKYQKKSIPGRNIDEPQLPRSQNSAADDAKRPLQMHKDKEVVLPEKIEQKRQTRCLLEERMQRELAELKKKEKELTAAEEQELIAEQEKRRQEVMLQKQRATAETAARINAERAREREKAMGASFQSPASSTPQLSVPDRLVNSDNPVTTTTSKPAKKPKLLSGGVRPEPTAEGQSQAIATSNSLPSSVQASSAVIGLRSSKIKPSVNTCPENVKVGHNNSRTATLVTEKSSRNFFMGTLPTSTPINDVNGVEDLHVYRHSNDPGNLCVVPHSRVPPTSPEAQAANLRFVKDGNGVHRDAYTWPHPKPEFEPVYQSTLHQNSLVSVKKEPPIATPLIGPQARRPIEPAPPKSADSSLNCSLPAKPHSSASLPSIRSHSATDEDVSMDQRGVTETTEAVPTSSTIVHHVINASSTAPPSVTWRPPSNVTPPILPNPHRDNLSSPRFSLKPTKPQNAPLTTPLATLDMTAVGSIMPDDATHIAPVIHANDGWDRLADEEVFSSECKTRELTPPTRPRQLRRGGDHYSPPPRAHTPNHYVGRGYALRSISPAARSPISPVQRSPVLGKRRHREDGWEDEHPPRRQWATDGTRRTRSPPPHFRQTQRRSPTPDRPALQARMQVNDHPEILRAQLPSGRELAWRSPSPSRPALQARIGDRDPSVRAIKGGQSYRPTYYSDTRTRDNHQSRPADQSAPGNRLGPEPEPRGPSYNRSRGSMNGNRASPRGRGSRGGNRLSNLEQRISSAKPLTLINRLESLSRT